ncbi:MAG: PP0621 family protein [Rhodoferax sp.]
MKYLLLLLLALLIMWQWRGWRGRGARNDTPAAGGAARPIEMVACLQCGMHVAVPEAVTGRLGSYCSAAHRQRHEA